MTAVRRVRLRESAERRRDPVDAGRFVEQVAGEDVEVAVSRTRPVREGTLEERQRDLALKVRVGDVPDRRPVPPGRQIGQRRACRSTTSSVNCSFPGSRLPAPRAVADRLRRPSSAATSIRRLGLRHARRQRAEQVPGRADQQRDDARRRTARSTPATPTAPPPTSRPAAGGSRTARIRTAAPGPPPRRSRSCDRPHLRVARGASTSDRGPDCTSTRPSARSVPRRPRTAGRRSANSRFVPVQSEVGVKGGGAGR